MEISKFNEDYSEKLEEYIDEYTNYLNDDSSTDENLITRNQELKNITTNFIKKINKKSDELDKLNGELLEKKKIHQGLNSELGNSQKKSEENKNFLVMLKKKEQNLVNNHDSKNKIIKPLFYINCLFAFLVLVGALYITKNRLLLWFMEFISNLALDIYLSLGTLAKYILNTFFGFAKNNRNNRNNKNRNNNMNNKNSNRRNRQNSNTLNRNSPITNKSINNTN